MAHGSDAPCEKAKAAVRARKSRADARRPSAHQRGYDQDWQNLRDDFLNAHAHCIRCGGTADLVDHIQTIREAPNRRLDPKNLQALCTSCHSSWKQARDIRKAP
jgi:5-methylcytosine-specific restriction endonuclease McrA